jgi:transposase InsO family protein
MEGAGRKWAAFRFGVIGQLLAAPPQGRGELAKALSELAGRTWAHPTTGRPARFGASTIERWYYRARQGRGDPITTLARRVRSDVGRSALLSTPVRDLIFEQYRAHPSWSVKLHHDNLLVLAEKDSALVPPPSYQTLRRFMRGQGLVRQRRRHRSRRDFAAKSSTEDLPELPHEVREVRSFEATHVGGLLHLDFHHGKLRVLTQKGEMAGPIALAMIDDHSRLCCHVQWYFDETTKDLVHGFSQALMKRGLPRALMTDNGGAMSSAEFTEGLVRLGITHRPTMAYSPHQNAKIESFWGVLEGRLVAMVEGVSGKLTLDELNRATIAWVEQEYNRQVHSQTGETPMARFLAGPSVMRPCPDAAALRAAFRTEERRRQRRSDGTIVIGGARFEVPQPLRHLPQLTVRFARWDLGRVDVVDERTGAVVCPLYPLDRAKNADSQRRVVEPASTAAVPAGGEVAPLLQKLITDYESTGLPPAFLSQTHDEEI